MSKALLSASPEARAAIAQVFEKAPPILVEVRFPGCGTSPDWHLCGDEEELNEVLERVGPGAELHLLSVWNIKNTTGELVVRK